MSQTIEQANARIAELEGKLKAYEPAPKVSGKTLTLISEAKLRCFDVDPSHVIKIVRGAHEQMLLKSRIVRIMPGSIVEFDEEFAKFLLTYKTFKVYGV